MKPIDASHGLTCGWDFPDRAVGASLKPGWLRLRLRREEYFPDRAVGASLKQKPSSFVFSDLFYFPDRAVGASLKLGVGE